MSNLNHIISRQLGVGAFFSVCTKPHLRRVFMVFATGHPVKIVRSVISLIPVFVIRLMLFGWWWTDECPRNYTRDGERSSNSLFVKLDCPPAVCVRNWESFKNSSRSCTNPPSNIPDPSQVARFIKSLVTGNRFPDFPFHTEYKRRIHVTFRMETTR